MANKYGNGIDRVEGIRGIDSRFKKYFVVLRDNRRVSSDNHVDYSSAKKEEEYWVNIIRKFPHGSKLKIVECKNKTPQ